MLRLSLIGLAASAVCCFTPLALLAMGSLGLAAYVNWIDVIALPALAVFACLAGFAMIRRRGS